VTRLWPAVPIPDMASSIPVITVDGPSGVGKGTVAHQLACELGWHLLDSGALYRVTAYACARQGVELGDHAAVAAVARSLEVKFKGAETGEVLVFYRDEDASSAIRTEEGGRGASTVGAIPEVREALLQRQRDFLMPPGLIADGRDMGTVVFPDAALKFFLVASAQERAERRYRQLLEKGESVSLPRLLRDIQERDERDRSRSVSPLVAADDAVVIDSTEQSIDAVFAMIMRDVNKVFPELQPA
jgi:cytidylate kinase